MASFGTTKFKLKITNHKFKGTCLIGNSLTDGWLHVVAADIVEPNAVVVEVIEDGQAELISLTVVRLGQSMTEKRVSRIFHRKPHYLQQFFCFVRCNC